MNDVTRAKTALSFQLDRHSVDQCDCAVSLLYLSRDSERLLSLHAYTDVLYNCTRFCYHSYAILALQVSFAHLIVVADRRSPLRQPVISDSKPDADHCASSIHLIDSNSPPCCYASRLRIPELLLRERILLNFSSLQPINRNGGLRE
ncbi:hypothetical protein RvY_07802-2 [Ramazzottius varieornatus]|uniref:Uncharacterized protein n=1 Tax=Ramazzottius varieornatus TaxID=947166 RepID=A0A1D1V8H1_RAMVA|nr:hypothetical protein RvY_07802-2 [Ramazzottius varieornatus]